MNTTMTNKAKSKLAKTLANLSNLSTARLRQGLKDKKAPRVFRNACYSILLTRQN